MIIIKELKKSTDKDVTDSIYFTNNLCDILINSKSCLQSLLKLANSVIPQKINYKNMDELVLACNIHKENHIRKIYTNWY